MSANIHSPEQIQPQVLARLAARAKEHGETINEFLQRMLDESDVAPAQTTPLPAVEPYQPGASLEEFMAAMESLPDDTEGLPPSAIPYSREDIYFDHD
jgi:hypothetical protein